MRLLAERTPSSTWVPEVGNTFPGREKGEQGVDEREITLIFRVSDGKYHPGLISQETSIPVCQAFQAFHIHPPEHPCPPGKTRFSSRCHRTLSIIKTTIKNKADDLRNSCFTFSVPSKVSHGPQTPRPTLTTILPQGATVIAPIEQRL